MITANNEDDGYKPKPQAVGVAAVALGSAITREQWIERCAARFRSVAGLEPAVAKHQATLQLGWLCDDLTEDPEEAADAEMQEWTD